MEGIVDKIVVCLPVQCPSDEILAMVQELNNLLSINGAAFDIWNFVGANGFFDPKNFLPRGRDPRTIGLGRESSRLARERSTALRMRGLFSIKSDNRATGLCSLDAYVFI